MKKKLVIMLFVLLVLSIAIGASPIVDYFYTYGAEAPAVSESVATGGDSSTVPSSSSAPETSGSAVQNGERHPNETAILSAVILSSGTIVIALAVFIKQHNPDD